MVTKLRFLSQHSNASKGSVIRQKVASVYLQEKIAIIPGINIPGVANPFTDFASTIINVPANILRDTESHHQLYNRLGMAGSALGSGLKGRVTNPLMSGIFSASPLSQYLDPVKTSEDVGLAIRQALLQATPEERPALLQTLKQFASEENIRKLPTEYRAGVRALARMPENKILTLIQREAAPIGGKLADRTKYILGSLFGALAPMGQPMGDVSWSAVQGANMPWLLQESADAAGQKVKDDIIHPKKRGPIREFFRRQHREFLKGIAEGSVATDQTKNPLLRGAKKGLGLLVAPAVRSALEQAQFAKDVGVRALEEGATQAKHVETLGKTIPMLPGANADITRRSIADVVNNAPQTKLVQAMLPGANIKINPNDVNTALSISQAHNLTENLSNMKQQMRDVTEVGRQTNLAQQTAKQLPTANRAVLNMSMVDKGLSTAGSVTQSQAEKALTNLGVSSTNAQNLSRQAASDAMANLSSNLGFIPGNNSANKTLLNVLHNNPSASRGVLLAGTMAEFLDEAVKNKDAPATGILNRIGRFLGRGLLRK